MVEMATEIAAQAEPVGRAGDGIELVLLGLEVRADDIVVDDP